jgi:hypothetical protein
MTLLEESDSDRAQRYLRMAEETAAMARRSTDRASTEAYMHLATLWTQMAEELATKVPANQDDETDDQARA